MIINLDFETRNVVDIKAGVSKYAETAEVLCLAYSIDRGPISTWRPGEPEPPELLSAIESGAEARAWNAAFERTIWAKVMVPRHGWPPVAKWRCTMAAALACGLPGALEQAAKALNLSVEKDMAGRRLMLKMSKPRKPTKNNPSIWHEKPEDFDRLLAYCTQDVRTEMAVDEIVDPLWSVEEQVYEYDYKVNCRGVKFDRPLVHACIDVWGKYLKRLNKEISELTFGLSSSQVGELLSMLQSLGTPIGTLDKRAVANALKADGLSSTARRVLEIRQLAAKSSVSKFKRILQCIEEDDRIRGCTQYHGARTGRFAGRLIQLQNLPRGIVAEDQIEQAVQAIMAGDVGEIEKIGPVGDVLASMVRCSIIADEGKKLIPCDFAAIEARCLAWTAKEEWLLEAFRKGDDAYKHMASSIFNVPYAEVTKDLRWWGKTVLLGAGYMLGGAGLLRQLDAAGVKAELSFATKLIEGYRKRNKRIVAHWYAIENAAVACVSSGRPQKVWPFTYHMKGRWLCCRLPSGRDIRYLDPKLVPGMFDKPQVQFTGIDITGKPVRENTYAGKLVENNTQALCRDVLVHAMSRLERNGYPVVFHVHDEVVPEIENGTIEDVQRIMTEVPDWAAGFPINAEGFETQRYRK